VLAAVFDRAVHQRSRTAIFLTAANAMRHRANPADRQHLPSRHEKKKKKNKKTRNRLSGRRPGLCIFEDRTETFQIVTSNIPAAQLKGFYRKQVPAESRRIRLARQ